jgi:threonine/homoserine/homoserine lactone efflux protein
MIDFQLFSLFIITSMVLLFSPGPAVLYVISKSIEHGPKAGIASVLGIGIGNLVHVIAAALGLSVIIMQSITLFTIVKIIGAFYLIFLGIKSFRQKQTLNFDNVEKTKSNLKKTFIDGIIVNVFNPKAAMFFIAFIPQFLNIEYGHIPTQIIFYGITFTLLALVADTMYVLLSGKIRNLISENAKFQLYQKYIIGSIYMILGLLTIMTDFNPKSEK